MGAAMWRRPSPSCAHTSNRAIISISGQVIQITRATCWLRGGSRRRFPRNICEVKELGHIHLCGVALGQTGKTKPRFYEFEPGGVIGDGVGHEMLPGEWRDDNEW